MCAASLVLSTLTLTMEITHQYTTRFAQLGGVPRFEIDPVSSV
jgi:hypothetical protein